MANTAGSLAYFRRGTMNNPLRGGMINLKGNIEADMDSIGLPSNPEGYAMMGLTYAAAMSPGSTIGKSFDNINAVVVTAKYPRNYTPATTEGADATVIRGADHPNGDTPTYVPQRGNDNDYGDYGPRNIHDCPDPDAVNMYNTIVNAHSDWIGNFFVLLASAQPQDLTASHFKSYFAWKRTPNIEGEVLAKHFPNITGGQPEVLDSNDMRSLLPKEKWVEYRTTFSTAGLLLDKMLKECPKDYLGVFSDATKDRVQEYVDSKHSEVMYRAIPEKALGIMYSYLMVTEQLVDNLWGPKRAYEKFTVQEKASLKTWFTEAKGKMLVYKKGTLGVGGTDMPRGVWDVQAGSHAEAGDGNVEIDVLGSIILNISKNNHNLQAFSDRI